MSNDVNFLNLPSELLNLIFSKLSEIELGRLSRTCKLFNEIIENDFLTWKRLYREIFEYDLPLMPKEDDCDFEFIPIKEFNGNLWKLSLAKFYKAIHVRLDNRDIYKKYGRHIIHFNNLETAVEFAQRSYNVPKLIFIHTGKYEITELIINRRNLCLIGASSGNKVAESVILNCDPSFPVSLYLETNCYVGHLSLTNVSIYPQNFYLDYYTTILVNMLDGKDCGIIDNCEFSTYKLHNEKDERNAIVSGKSDNIIWTKAIVKNCFIKRTEGNGILAERSKILIENNKICCIKLDGISIKKSYYSIKCNKICNIKKCGIVIYGGTGKIIYNDIYNTGSKRVFYKDK